MIRVLFLLTTAVVLNFDSTMAVEYSVYLPIVHRSPEKAGYAHARMSVGFEETLEMHSVHGWDLFTASSAYIPHFSCEVRPYWMFGDDGVDQFVELEKYVDDMGDTSFVLIFLNEPDLPRQCNRTPWHSAMMYAKVIEVAPNAILTTPQVSHLDYLADWEWMREWYYWIDRQNLPHPKIGGIHTYMSEQPSLILDSFWENFDVETMWVTEFGNSDPEILGEMIRTYRDDERVSKYFYFDPRGSEWAFLRLINDDGSLTPLGEVWVENH